MVCLLPVNTPYHQRESDPIYLIYTFIALILHRKTDCKVLGLIHFQFGSLLTICLKAGGGNYSDWRKCMLNSWSDTNPHISELIYRWNSSGQDIAISKAYPPLALSYWLSPRCRLSNIPGPRFCSTLVFPAPYRLLC